MGYNIRVQCLKMGDVFIKLEFWCILFAVDWDIGILFLTASNQENPTSGKLA
jgi:hypothetical protein